MDGSGVLAVNESRDAGAQGPGDLKLALQTESKLVDRLQNVECGPDGILVNGSILVPFSAMPCPNSPW
jgi:hypothetical protein